MSLITISTSTATVFMLYLAAVTLVAANMTYSAIVGQCRLRPFHLQDQIYGSCPDFADLSPRNESNYAIAAGPFPCGSCVRVTFQMRELFVIVVDSISSPGLDLHLQPLAKLAGSADPSMLIQGLHGCQVEHVPLEMCRPSNSNDAGVTQPIQQQQQPWANPAPVGFGPLSGAAMPAQGVPNMFAQQGQQQQAFQTGAAQFDMPGSWRQPPLEPMRPPQQPMQAGWHDPLFGNGPPQQPYPNRMAQMMPPPNLPIFLRRKTQIRVYD